MKAIIERVARSRALACAEKKDRAGALKWLKHIQNREFAAEVLVKLGDLAGASNQLERAGQPKAAADLALKAGDPQRAANILASSGDTESAARLLAEHGSPESAADLFLRCGRKLEAAKMLEAAGKRAQAAQVFVECGEFGHAIELHRQSGNVAGLIGAYLARGDLPVGAEDCLARGEMVVAAALFERAGKLDDAAEVHARSGNKLKAAELFEKAGSFARAGDLFRDLGKLDDAVRVYEQAPERAVEAAELYSRMILLTETSRQQFEYGFLCGAVSQESDHMVLGTTNRAIIYAGPGFKPLWNFKVSGEQEPRFVAISNDGNLIAVAAHGPDREDSNLLMLIDSEKRVLWEKETTEPARALVFSPDAALLYVALGDETLAYKQDGSIVFSRQADFKPWTLSLGPNRFAVGTLGGTVCLYDPFGVPLRETKLGERVHSIRFLGDDRLIAGVGENRLEVLDGSSLEITSSAKHPHSVRFVESFPGRRVAIAAGSDQLTVVDERGESLSTVRMGKLVLACMPDVRGKQVHVSLEDRTIVTFGAQDCRKKSADSYVKGKRFAEAAAIYQQIEDYETAYKLFTQVGDFERAADAVELAGDVTTAARHYEVVGRFDKAAELYRQMGDRYQTARCLGKAGRNGEAAELFEEIGDLIVAADFYERAADYKRAGTLFHRADQFERAVSNLEMYLREFPNDRDATFELGRLYADLEKHDDAIRLLQQLTDDEKHRRESLRLLGECFMKSKLFDVALDRLHEAIGDNAKVSRENIDLFYDLGLTYEFAGRFVEAKDTYGKVLAIDLNYRDTRQRLLNSEQMSAVASRGEVPCPPVSATGATVVRPAMEREKRYKIIRKIGQGGMGVVYLALDTKLNRQVAWKVLPSHLASEPEARQRMLREAQTVAQFSHPNIIAIYDIAATEEESYITMEFVEGITLREQIRNCTQLPFEDAVRYASQIATALEAAHRHGVVHRDIKPENIMLKQPEDLVKVLDFGLAQLGEDMRITREGMIVGTLSYMAPEQVQGKGIDARTDIYAFGIVMFEMLAGRVPFVGANVLAQQLHEEAPPLAEFRPDVPPELAALVSRCLAKPKDERPASCAQIITNLADIASLGMTNTPGSARTAVINLEDLKQAE